MTAQIPDELQNELPDLTDLTDLRLYDILVFDENSQKLVPYPYINQPTPRKLVMRATCLWRKYIASFKLTDAKEIVLIKYDYSFLANDALGFEPDYYNEKLCGNYWLVMRKNQSLNSKGFLIPFIDGKMRNRGDWISTQNAHEYLMVIKLITNLHTMLLNH